MINQTFDRSKMAIFRVRIDSFLKELLHPLHFLIQNRVRESVWEKNVEKNFPDLPGSPIPLALTQYLLN